MDWAITPLSCPPTRKHLSGTHMNTVSRKHRSMGCPYGAHIGLLVKKTIWTPYCNSYGPHMGFYVLHHGWPLLGHRWASGGICCLPPLDQRWVSGQNNFGPTSSCRHQADGAAYIGPTSARRLSAICYVMFYCVYIYTHIYNGPEVAR